ncbi:putative bifunctional diguanylate cyclase/phosphodiesterase [Sinomonas sp. RB5]
MAAEPTDDRLEKLIDLIVRLSAGDLSRRMETSPARDSIDAVTTGINLLAEELETLYDQLEARIATRTEQLERAQDELRRLVDTDELTGLASRRLVRERIDAALQTADDGGLAAVVILALRGFRLINETFGHSAGDAVLIEVAQRVQAAMGGAEGGGHLVGRLGGDEFAVLVTGQDAEGVLWTARAVLDTLKERVLVNGIQVSLRGNVGIRYAERHLAVEEMLRDADAALESGKAKGHGGISVFTPAMHEVVAQRVRVASELRAAFSNGEIEVFYQPIVGLADGMLAGAEALVRWRHPVRGLQPPSAFLDIAEDAGLMVELGRCVLTQVVQAAGDWARDPGLPEHFSLHVNISPAELAHGDLTAHIRRLLDEAGLPGPRLTVEITESAIISGGPDTRLTLRSLGELGVPIEIDDFGTGYSSISYLRTLPAVRAKIDKSLVDTLASDPTQVAFVDAIVRLIHAAGLTVVAEGIEGEAQARLLRELGCEYGQGYLFARPMPASELGLLLRSLQEGGHGAAR